MIEAEQALETISRRDIEQANLHAIPIAGWGQDWLRSKGIKEPETYRFNPFGEMLYKQQSKDEIDPAIARLWLELTAEHKVPSWAIAAVDMDLIRAAAS